MIRPGSSVCIAILFAGVGCAHHRNDYAYAPPYAPPVYPQPQAASVQPVALAGAPSLQPGVVPASAVPMGVMPAAPVMTSQTNPCPQDCTEGMTMAAPVVFEEGGQTPPCPPGL